MQCRFSRKMLAQCAALHARRWAHIGQHSVPEGHRTLKFVLGLFLGLSIAASARAQNGTIIHFIRATVPAGATTGPVTVTNAGGAATSTQTFTVTRLAPTT